MDLGESDGGLPPDALVEDARRGARRHGAARTSCTSPSPGRWTQIAVAPCSPFSVTKRLMVESAELARRLGLALHTHLAETVEEEEYCQGIFGCRPVEYLEQLGWLDGDVWCAHCVHLSAEDIGAFARERHRRRALPDLEPAARRRRRARAATCWTRACRSGSASTAPPRTSAATSSSR